jgi:hypothetical protein
VTAMALALSVVQSITRVCEPAPLKAIGKSSRIKNPPRRAGRMDKDVDLAPHEWESEREKPKEPFFGPGVFWFIEVVIIWAVVTTIVHYWR